MRFSLDFSEFSIDIPWKEIGKALLSITGTGFLTLMVFALTTMTDGTYQPSSPPTDFSVVQVVGSTGGVLMLGAFVQLTVYGCYRLSGWIVNRLRRIPVDK